MIGARIAETPDGVGYDTVYVLDDPPTEIPLSSPAEVRREHAGGGGGGGLRTAATGGGTAVESVSSAPAAAFPPSAEGQVLEPEPEIEPAQPKDVAIRRLGSTVMRQAARLVDEESGRVMEVQTNQPCLICYSANYLLPNRNAASAAADASKGKGNQGKGNSSNNNRKKNKKQKRSKRRRRQDGEQDQHQHESSGGGTSNAAAVGSTSGNASGSDAENSRGGSGGDGGDRPAAGLDNAEASTVEEGDEELTAVAESSSDSLAARHRQWGAVCLETVNYIGSLRFKQLPSMVLHPGQEYYHKTVHSFSTVQPYGLGSARQEESKAEDDAVVVDDAQEQQQGENAANAPDSSAEEESAGAGARQEGKQIDAEKKRRSDSRSDDDNNPGAADTHDSSGQRKQGEARSKL